MTMAMQINETNIRKKTQNDIYISGSENIYNFMVRLLSRLECVK